MKLRLAALVVNRDRVGKSPIVDELTGALRKLGAKTVVLDRHPAEAKPDLPSDTDLVLSLGGDGTLLYTAEILDGRAVPVLAVNMGGLGFIAVHAPGGLAGRLPEILQSGLPLSERMMLSVRVGGKKERLSRRCLNDVIIHRGGDPQLVTVHVAVNGKDFGTFRTDGFLVATPTGSTAYNLATGGPVMEPGLSALVLNAICPHSLTSRPVIVRGDAVVELRVAAPRPGTNRERRPVLSLDGREGTSLDADDVVSVRRDESRLLLVEPPGSDFYHVLRAKMNWSA